MRAPFVTTTALMGSAMFWIIGCRLFEFEDPEAGVSTEQIVSLTSDPSVIDADGVDETTLTATLLTGSDANKVVRFTTERGAFRSLPGAEDLSNRQTLQMTASGRTAVAKLISQSDFVGPVTVSAAVSDFIALEQIEFQRALPDEMVITATKLAIQADRVESTTITVFLFRDSGKVSDGSRVDFTAVANNSTVADMVPFAFTVDGAATVDVRSATTTTGFVTITATVTAADGTPLSKSITIELL